jgi:hypothetical protein
MKPVFQATRHRFPNRLKQIRYIPSCHNSLRRVYSPTKTVNPTTSFHRQKIVFNNLTIQKYVTRVSFWKTPLRALGSKYTTRAAGEHIRSWTVECFPHVDRNISFKKTACLYSQYDSVIENSLLMSVHTNSNNAHYELAWTCSDSLTVWARAKWATLVVSRRIFSLVFWHCVVWRCWDRHGCISKFVPSISCSACSADSHSSSCVQNAKLVYREKQISNVKV